MTSAHLGRRVIGIDPGSRRFGIAVGVSGVASPLTVVQREKSLELTVERLAKLISEEEAKMNKPDYFLVLPWHFKDNILGREKEYLKTGVKFIFPLPEIEII